MLIVDSKVGKPTSCPAAQTRLLTSPCPLWERRAPLEEEKLSSEWKVQREEWCGGEVAVTQ